jgi:hypothetical protein
LDVEEVGLGVFEGADAGEADGWVVFFCSVPFQVSTASFGDDTADNVRVTVTFLTL